MAMSRSEAGKLGHKKSLHVRMDKYAQIRLAYETAPKLCIYCCQPLSYVKRYNKFCNRSCAASETGKGVRRHGKAPGVCLLCGRRLDKSASKFCSRSCFNNYRWIKLKGKIRSTGKLDGLIFSPQTARKFLFEEGDKKCEICGITHWCGQPVPLVMDHTDGNAENEDLSNLRLICGNCNMLLPTFAGRNLGKGRKDRRERYRSVKDC